MPNLSELAECIVERVLAESVNVVSPLTPMPMPSCEIEAYIQNDIIPKVDIEPIIKIIAVAKESERERKHEDEAMRLQIALSGGDKAEDDEAICYVDPFASDDDDDCCGVPDYEVASGKKKIFPLAVRKGVQQFHKYLRGFPGEKKWNLWMDIERVKMLADNNQLNK